MVNKKPETDTIVLTYDEKILTSTGLAILYRMMLNKEPLLKKLLEEHPRLDLVKIDKIKKLNKKFQVRIDQI